MHHHVPKPTSVPALLAVHMQAPAFLVGKECQSENDIDHAFISILEGYGSSGGLARAREVFALFKSRSGLGVDTLARWIAHRRVLSLEWHGEVWLPLFQFERQHMTLKPALKPVLVALNPVFTPWQLTHWCAQPHCWLNGERPVDALDTDAARVLHAAHIDRYALL